MLYCDKPDWSKLSETELNEVAKKIAEYTHNLTIDGELDFTFNADDGDIQIECTARGGHIEDLFVSLWWADRDGEMPDEPIEDDTTTAEDLERIILAL